MATGERLESIAQREPILRRVRDTLASLPAPELHDLLLLGFESEIRARAAILDKATSASQREEAQLIFQIHVRALERVVDLTMRLFDFHEQMRLQWEHRFGRVLEAMLKAITVIEPPPAPFVLFGQRVAVVRKWLRVSRADDAATPHDIAALGLERLEKQAQLRQDPSHHGTRQSWNDWYHAKGEMVTRAAAALIAAYDPFVEEHKKLYERVPRNKLPAVLAEESKEVQELCDRVRETLDASQKR